MHELLNVLYVVTPGAMLHLDHDAVRVEVEHETRARFPLIRLSGIVLLGRVMLSPYLIQRCADDGRSLVWLDDRGRFKARVEGATRGNVLLRRVQHLALSDEAATQSIARQIVAGKIQNSRQVVLRAARDASNQVDRETLGRAADRMAAMLTPLRDSASLDTTRGFEGECASTYFDVFPRMLRADRRAFTTGRRTRRPPRDRLNAVLSFLYALVRSECASALEGVGLDPQIGYLHSIRPGRPALALDLMEEFRSVIADRMALTLVNRGQLKPDQFDELPGGAVHLSDAGRRVVIEAFQRRKQVEVEHRVMKQKVPIGLLPHLQARLLARHLRGDLAHYPPYLYR